MSNYRRLAIPLIAMVVFLAACTGNANDLLSQIKTRGTLIVSTDPNYAPQSFLRPDGTYEGFDIDVAKEIASRLDVDIQFETPEWEAITAGSWSGRWDVSVGSMTITAERKGVLAFSTPYYYTPAQMAATVASGITTLDGLAGKTVCVGESTTYGDWLNGALNLVDAPTPATPPANVTVTTLPTDANCAESVQSGRTDFEGFLSSATVIEQTIGEGIAVVAVGDPVFYEPLAVAIDLGGPEYQSLLTEIDRILQEMRDDGTLTSLSNNWFGIDLTVLASS